MIKVNVFTEEKSWAKKLYKKEIFFNQLCKFFPKRYRFVNKKIYFNLLLSNNKSIRKFNKKFRKKNKHTDILSFPLKQNSKNLREICLGDIIISFNYINKPKDISKNDFKKKVSKTFIHGFLHLLGFDHIKEKEYKRMFKLEQKIFNSVKKFIN